MHTWVFDEAGVAGAILDEFCIRTTLGEPAAWVFGLSLFSISGEHIGWFEDGVLFDVDNRMLGFVPGAAGLAHDFPAMQAAPPMPPMSKRPHVPTLRARPARPQRSNWSACTLADYLERFTMARTAPLGLPALAHPAAQSANSTPH